jgi:hypothetical protein
MLARNITTRASRTAGAAGVTLQSGEPKISALDNSVRALPGFMQIRVKRRMVCIVAARAELRLARTFSKRKILMFGTTGSLQMSMNTLRAQSHSGGAA